MSTRRWVLLDGGCLNCGRDSLLKPCGCAFPSPDYLDTLIWHLQRVGHEWKRTNGH